MMQWLPLWRTIRNPLASRIRQTSLPERIRNLPNRYLNLCHKDFVMKALRNLRFVSGFEK
jgi:hypothetical protein